MVWADRRAVRIVAIGGEAEAEARGVALAAARIELHEARGAAKQKNENAGGKGIERAKMADLAETGEVAHRVHDVVGSLAFRLVNDQSAVEGSGLGLARH